jgi:serine/threonine-protein kinase
MNVDGARLGAGRVFADRYELRSLLGTGGMSEVWRALDTSLDREVAVKAVTGPASESNKKRIEREALALASLSHPNIVAVYDSGEDDGVPFIVMELVDGTDLHRYLAERGPLTVAETVEIMEGVLAGIDRAHASGVVHGDLKPANIFIGSHGPKVGDFGVARILEHETGTTTVAATPSYAAPEVLRGERATPRSDVYSAGCVLYEMLAGRAPFVGTNGWDVAQQHLNEPPPKLARVRTDVPADLDAIVRRSLDKDEKRRFPRAAAFAAALREPVAASATVPVAAEGATVPVSGLALVPPEAPATEVLPPRRVQKRWPLIAALVIGLLLVLAGLFVHAPSTPSATAPPVSFAPVVVSPSIAPTTAPAAKPSTRAVVPAPRAHPSKHGKHRGKH